MSDWASDDVVHDAARAIQGVTPEGYGLNFKEACDFARAALSAVNPYEWAIELRDALQDSTLASFVGCDQNQDARFATVKVVFAGGDSPDQASRLMDAIESALESFPPSPEGDK